MVASYHCLVFHATSLRFDGGFLIGRVLACAVVVAVTGTPNSPVLVVVAMVAAYLTTVALATNRRWLLPYGFLAATALWGGAAAMVVVEDYAPLALLFALTMACFDGSAFVALRCGDRS